MTKPKLRIGIIGCGAIGSFVARTCQERLPDEIEIAGVCDTVRPKAESLVRALKNKIEIFEIDELINKSNLIVEAASKEVSASIAEKALSNGKSVMVMSVAGLLAREDLFGLAAKKEAQIFIPSGALCGLDALKAAAMSDIKSVVLTTKKPPKGLEGAPYLVKNNIDLSRIKKETVLFEGNAREAIEGFPKNVNVAACLSLAALGPEKTKVRIIASPSIKINIHEVQVSGDFGIFQTKTENVPFPKNPKTSFLAALSAIAALKSAVSSIKIGT